METKRVKELLNNFKGKKVIVLGDLYLDEYFHCTTNRFSPEAPVPRAVIQEIEHVPGCAANVAVALKSLGAEVRCFGVVGGDEKGRILQNKLLEKGIITSSIISDPTRSTGVFSRVLLGEKNELKQHIVRFDLENQEKMNPQNHLQIMKKLEPQLPDSDLLFIADYDESGGTGIITEEFMEELIPLTKKYGIKTVGITRRKSEFFKKVDLFICNKKEAEEISQTKITDDSSINLAASMIGEKLNIPNIIITKASEGVSIYADGGSRVSLPSFATKIVDVCGAGDAFSSGYALSSLTNATVEERGYIASCTAAVAASKPGTAPVYPDELIELASSRNCNHDEKVILDISQLQKHVQKLKNNGKKIVFTNGYFDLIHAGHIDFLSQAKKLGDELIVAINSDRSTRENKGNGRPILNEQERVRILASLSPVNIVTVFEELTPLKIISTIKPDILVKGSTYMVDDIVGKDLLETNGCQVKIIPVNTNMSTDTIIERILKSEGNR